MASEEIKKEIQAIGTLLETLSPLSVEARVSVLDYVIKKLSISIAKENSGGNKESLDALSDLRKGTGKQPAKYEHISELVDAKKPKTANEMAAIVAYFLASQISEDQRKTVIVAKDIETYFKIANFPLPGQSRMTLINAKNAGYLDSAGSGEYRLNAVGHNLVVHGLPRVTKPQVRAVARPRKRSRKTPKAKKS